MSDTQMGPMESWVREHTRTTNAEYYNIPNLLAKAREVDAEAEQQRALIAELAAALAAYVHNDGDQFLEPDDPLYGPAVAALAKVNGVTV